MTIKTGHEALLTKKQTANSMQIPYQKLIEEFNHALDKGDPYKAALVLIKQARQQGIINSGQLSCIYKKAAKIADRLPKEQQKEIYQSIADNTCNVSMAHKSAQARLALLENSA